MIFDVAVAGRLLGEERPFELGEDHLVGLAEDVGEDVQAAAMRHPDHHLLDAEIAALLDDRCEQRDQRVPPSSENRLAVG